MMKKLIVIAAVFALLVTATACGTNAGKVSNKGNASSQVSAVSKPQQPDTLKGLCSYLNEKGGVSGESTETTASIIGAKTGVKYHFKYEGNNNVIVELYEYDLENLNDTAKSVLESAKQNNTIKVLGQPVANVYVSNSGKYLMIYNDTQEKEKNISHKKEIVKAFQEFRQD